MKGWNEVDGVGGWERCKGERRVGRCGEGWRGVEKGGKVGERCGSGIRYGIEKGVLRCEGDGREGKVGGVEKSGGSGKEWGSGRRVGEWKKGRKKRG